MLDTIVLTTKQWEESAYQYTAIKKGVLCIELTNDDKMMAKMGIGNKYYQELPYLTFDIGSIQIDITKLKEQTKQNTSDISDILLHLADIDNSITSGDMVAITNAEIDVITGLNAS